MPRIVNNKLLIGKKANLI